MNSAETLNIPFARKVLEHLYAHPEEHNQCHFAYRNPCGTTACIAGTALLMDSETTIDWSLMGSMSNVQVGDRFVDLETRAIELLGLSYRDSQRLFYTIDNEAALESLANHIAEAEAVQAVTP